VTAAALTLLLAVWARTDHVQRTMRGEFQSIRQAGAIRLRALWSLIPMTIALSSPKRCARGWACDRERLSDLIREEFGFRSTFFVMIAVSLLDLANVVAEFAGVAASMQIFGGQQVLAVPDRGDRRVVLLFETYTR